MVFSCMARSLMIIFKISIHLLARLGSFCSVASETVIFCENGVVKFIVPGGKMKIYKF